MTSRRIVSSNLKPLPIEQIRALPMGMKPKGDNLKSQPIGGQAILRFSYIALPLELAAGSPKALQRVRASLAFPQNIPEALCGPPDF